MIYLLLFLVETNLPTPMNGRVYVKIDGILLEGKWLFIAGKIHRNRRFSGKPWLLDANLILKGRHFRIGIS